MKKIILATVCGGLMLASCGTDNASGTKNNRAAEQPAGNDVEVQGLVNNPEKPAGESFTKRDFEGIGTVELPSGEGWLQEGNVLKNEKLNMEIVIQSQPQSMIGQEKEYLDAYNDVNVSAAEGWTRGTETMGQIKGVKAARTEGSFNNGTPMATRDYIFFDAGKTAIIQLRAAATNKSMLVQMADYIAGSYQQK